MQPEVSVVAAAHNSEKYLLDFLQALQSQTLAADRFEVTVVDDASTDRTSEILAEWASHDPRRHNMIRANGKGPAHARNLGVRAARGEWVALTDSDTIPDSDWLEAGLEAVHELGVDAMEGAIYPVSDDATGRRVHNAFNVEGGLYMTGNMIVLRRLLLEIGGFDERFDIPCVEDRELAMRILGAGHKIPFVPGVRVRHRVLPQGPIDLLRLSRRYTYIGLVWANIRRCHMLTEAYSASSTTSTSTSCLLGLGWQGFGRRPDWAGSR